MAKVAAHGTDLLTYLSDRRHGLIRYMSDGTVLRRTPFSGWKVFATAKNKHDLSAYLALVAKKRETVAAMAPWARVTSIPTARMLKEWSDDGVAETPTGYQVEPDGRAADGSPSWLLIFGLI